MSGVSKRNILITSSNFPKGSASANYLDLFCRGVFLSGRQIEVYLLKGFFLGGRKTNDTKRNITSYGAKYTYLNIVNRPSNKLLKLSGDIYAFVGLTLLLFSLLGQRRKVTIFAYNNELYHSILLNCFCKMAGIKVVTFVGPSSILLALMASGFNGQNFVFNGYLSNKKPELITQIKTLEQKVQKTGQTQIFMETPYRNAFIIETCLDTLNDQTRLCIACDINAPDEYIRQMRVVEWKKAIKGEYHKRPCIYLIGK